MSYAHHAKIGLHVRKRMVLNQTLMKERDGSRVSQGELRLNHWSDYNTL